MSLWDQIAEEISAATGEPFVVGGERSVGGGCINSATMLVGDDGRRYFVKLNDAARADMFEAEAEGLNELAGANAIRVPRPVCWGTAGGSAYIVMEYLDLGGGGRGSLDAFGAQLAALHRATSARYGWHRDNTIGSTPQINTQSDDWVSFWREHRLGFQLELAARHGHRGRLQQRGAELMERVGDFFDTYTPAASLLHGDLWGGNFAADNEGNPVIFDPAVYYGDREADLAMTELFGGFGGRFYDAYRDAYPLDPGYSVRKTFYNLYHIINHLNLFGGGYLGQAERMTEMLLSEVR
jgi:protein-ribulosamine 3-kinase